MADGEKTISFLRPDPFRSNLIHDSASVAQNQVVGSLQHLDSLRYIKLFGTQPKAHLMNTRNEMNAYSSLSLLSISPCADEVFIASRTRSSNAVTPPYTRYPPFYPWRKLDSPMRVARQRLVEFAIWDAYILKSCVYD